MSKESIGLKVGKENGEKILTLANKLGLTDKTLQIQKTEADILQIPIMREPDAQELKLLRDEEPKLQLGTFLFAEKKKPEKTLAEILKDEMDPNLLASLPRALDIVGDIAIIEIPSDLESNKNIIGKAILKTHRNIRVVLAKAGAISGTYRLREYDFIAGEHRTSTIYKEYGCSYYVDVAKAYFSPRLSHEHNRVAHLVQNGETIVDLFAGVGPFAVLIAKESKEVKVYGIDINADAVDLLEKNTRLNRVENRVYPIVGDARQVVNEKLQGIADRVIMNLPETASEFIDVACKGIKPSGGVVHFYGFIRLPETLIDLQKRFVEAVERNGRKVVTFLYSNHIRATAPFEWQVVLDALIS
jgi:tRNA (guanine37-N1)-methyltransferase